MMKLASYAFSATFLLASFGACAQVASGSMDVHWNEGAADCARNPPPPLQVHAYNERTFILRQSLCATYEGPFIYLLVGSGKALLIDTGDVSDPKTMPLAQTVLSLLAGAGASKLPLVVVHTHGHLDHRAGDTQFQSQPNVEVVPTDVDHVKQYFGFPLWPNGIAQIDLGDRIVDVMPAPGHHQAHVVYYDRQTGLFFSGDFLLPGRLLIEDTGADLVSARRVADFVKDRPVSHVLGGHIELDEGGNTFFGDAYHPHERSLQLSKQDLLDLPEVVAGFNGFYGQRGIHILMNQNRVLMLLGGAMLAAVVALVLGARWLWRRRKRSTSAGRSAAVDVT
ncbi:MBL fold metallo-hydrolase [Dokdonella soli]|uniref:Metallo-beta-lactamase domain-containing protein n=1 Tax=Dokdonella soli TaxID=529810 RepID=A0ABP3TQ94_9GAMM